MDKLDQKKLVKLHKDQDVCTMSNLHSNSKSELQHSIPNTLHQDRKDSTSQSLGKSSPNRKLAVLCCRGLRPASSVVDRDLWEWYCENVAQVGRKVTKTMVQIRAKQMYRDAGITDFKASDGWYRRWMNRWRRFGYSENIKTVPVIEENRDCKKTSSVNTYISKSVIEQKTVSENELVDSSSQNKTDNLQSVKDGESSLKSSVKRKSIKIGMSDIINNKCMKTSTVSISESSKQNITGSNTENETESMLSTPMLNIVDYLPPEIVQNYEGSLSNKAIHNDVSTGTVENTFGSPGIDASMDSLYYPPPYEFLPDCDGEVLSNMTAFPFELHQNETTSSGFPSGTDSERLKDLVGLISPQSNSSESFFNTIHEAENMLNVCSSEDSQDFVTSIFRNVTMHMDKQEETSNGSANLAALETRDVLAPEVILESQLIEMEKKTAKSEVPKEKTKKTKASHSTLGVTQRKKGERYLPQFKLKVLAYAANHTIKETAHKYKVNDGTIIYWKKEKDWLEHLKRNTGSNKSERRKKEVPPVHPVDQQFLTWLRRCREQKRDLTRSELQEKVKQLAGQEVEHRCEWFKMWVHRFFEKREQEEDLERMKPRQERHIQYPHAFKMEVALFAEQHNQLMAARTFSVPRKRVYDWLRICRERIAKESTDVTVDILAQTETIRCGSRRTNVDNEVDEELWAWYQAQVKKGNKPNWHEVQEKGLELYRAKGNKDIKCSYQWYKRWCDRFHIVLRHEGDDALLEWALTQLELGRSLTFSDLQVEALNLASDKAFRASRGWAIRFCKRHPQLLHQSPILDTALPSLLLQKVDNFRSDVRKIIQEKKLAPGCVGNMDELYLNFSVLVSGLNASVKRQQLVRKSEMENCHATIVLGCLADGTILPPAVVKVGGLEDVGPPVENVVVLQLEEGGMDAACIMQWLQLVWFKHVPTPNLLLMDCLKSHTIDSISTEFSNQQSIRLIIPGGCTSKLQPLDISLKHLFHAYIQKQWSAFNSRSSGTCDNGDNKLHLPGSKDIIEWVSAAHHQLQATEQEAVRRSFLMTGLTVALNKSEDHFIENLSMIPKSAGSISK